MNILKSVFSSGSKDSESTNDNGAESALTLDQARIRIEELRNTISGLKKRHERSIQLKAATCNTKRSIQKSQAEISRLRRRFPSIASAHQDTYRA
jgi:hypothetical protein